MGIFSFKEKYDIVPKENDLKTIVTKFGAVDVVKINAKLFVPTGYYFVIGKKGKVCDKFDEGEHYFSYANLPIMCRKFHIDKEVKSKKQDKIPADFYFVDKGLRAGKFETYRKVDLGTKAYGFFSAKVYGVYSYRVSDVKEYMQSLLNEFDYIKTGEAEDILEGWVNEIVVKELENQNFILRDVIENNPIIADALKLKVSKLFATAGLELVEFKITKYKLPKQYQAESDANIAKQTNEFVKVSALGVDEENEDCGLQEEKVDNNLKQLDKTETEPNTDVTIQEYYQIEKIDEDIADAQELLKAFGIGNTSEPEVTQDQQKANDDQQVLDVKNTQSENAGNELAVETVEEKYEIIEEKPIDELTKTQEEQPKNKIDEYIPFGSFVIGEADGEEIKTQAIKKSKEKTFVDLSLNELYNNNENTKRCLNCGMENHKDADHCIICGEKFNKGDIYE